MEEGKNNSCYSTHPSLPPSQSPHILGLVLGKPPQLQDMEHEVPAIDVLHDKEEVVPRLETGVEAGEERRLLLQGKHFALVQSALHVILLDDEVLLQALDGVYFTGTLVFGQKHLHTVAGGRVGDNPLPNAGIYTSRTRQREEECYWMW